MANGYHLFSTGEVLTAANVNDYLMKQTVMIFASASARTTALSGVLREGMISYRLDAHVLEVYNGTIWEAPETNLTTKGDLATFDTAPTRLAVGSDGQTLVANSANSSGLGWSATPSASNPVLNSAFQVWQRGTSITQSVAGSNVYTADRWALSVGANQASTVSRQVTGDTTNLPNIQYCARVQRNSGQTGTTEMYLTNSFETINTIPFAGKTVTVSFYARAGSNFSAASNAMKLYLMTGTGTDQSRSGTPYTGEVAAISQTATLTTTWQRFSYSATLNATTTELAILAAYTPVGTAGTNDYFELTGVQIDVGSVALPFRTFSQTLQGELAACQRYYWRAGGDSVYQPYAVGAAQSTTTAQFSVQNPVPMRIAPTSIDFSTVAVTDTINAYSISAITFANAGRYASTVNTAASSLTIFRPYIFVSNNSTSGYFGLSAEL